MWFDYPESNIRDGDPPTIGGPTHRRRTIMFDPDERPKGPPCLFVSKLCQASQHPNLRCESVASTTKCWQEPKVWHSGAPPRRVSQRTGKEGSQDQSRQRARCRTFFFFRGCDARCASIGGHSEEHCGWRIRDCPRVTGSPASGHGRTERSD